MDKSTINIIKAMPTHIGKKSFLSRFVPGRKKDLQLSENNYTEISKLRNNYLHNFYKGKTAYILSCGPSIDRVWDNKLEDFLSDKLVISIKQAHDLAPEISDFHLYNEVRMKSYNYPANTIKISCSKFSPDYPSHIHYPIREYKWEKSLFVTNEYERWQLDHSYERPWGVGIMFEIGLFLPIHLGCKRVLIIGFDMDPNGKYHFYDDSKEKDSKAYKVDRDEFKYVQATIPHLLSWARKLGVDLKLYSPLSALPIPQIRDVYSWV